MALLGAWAGDLQGSRLKEPHFHNFLVESIAFFCVHIKNFGDKDIHNR